MNPQNGQTPLDYLNQIAPQAPKRQLFTLNVRSILFLAGIALILVIILVVIGNAVAGANREPWERLVARLDATSAVVDSSTSKIKNSQLRSYNSDIRLTITNTQRDLAEHLVRRDIEAKKITPSIVTQETTTGITERLEDGRLNAKYDSTYAREMSYQLATILSLLERLYAAGGSQATKDFLSTTYDNLKPSYDAISKFSASNE
ncbi:MAG: hypothetical protein ACREGE_03335 [Candidatus Microsaccharimonas sp.]